jgi:hypothetical protein
MNVNPKWLHHYGTANTTHQPDEHLMQERHRREAAQRDARSGRPGKVWRGLSTGDKIIFLVLGVAALAGVWFFLSWLLTS